MNYVISQFLTILTTATYCLRLYDPIYAGVITSMYYPIQNFSFFDHDDYLNTSLFWYSEYLNQSLLIYVLKIVVEVSKEAHI